MEIIVGAIHELPLPIILSAKNIIEMRMFAHIINLSFKHNGLLKIKFCSQPTSSRLFFRSIRVKSFYISTGELPLAQ